MSTSLNETFDSYDQSEDKPVISQIADAFDLYYPPFLIIFGCVGNVIAVIVFQASKLREQTSSLYLTVLAISDTVFLCLLVFTWLDDRDAIILTNGFVQLSSYMSYVCCELSAWCVVAFTVERFIAIVYPFHVNIICSKSRARWIVGTLTAVSLLVNIPVTFMLVCDEDGDCMMRPGTEQLQTNFNIFDTVVAMAIPLLTIVTLNLWIFCKLRGYSEERQGLRQKRVSHRVTAMLLVTSSTFVLFNLPSSAMRIHFYANVDAYFDEDDYFLSSMQALSQQMFNTNFGINFYLYFLSGKSFRQALISTYSSIRAKQRSSTQKTTTEEATQNETVLL